MQVRFPLHWFLVVLIFVIAVADATALRYHLFFMYRWLDIPMHLLGGLWVSLFILWYHFVFRHKFVRIRNRRGAVALALSGTFAVALGWELFEYAVNAYIVLDRYDMMDTLKDLLMGMIGASVGARIFIYKTHKEHITQ